MTIRLSLFAALALTSAPAIGQDSNAPLLLGNWFVRNCDSPAWKLACAGYVLGYYQGSQSRVQTICLPSAVDNGQLYEIALAYMRAQPEKGHFVGMQLMDEAWTSAFPCPPA